MAPRAAARARVHARVNDVGTPDGYNSGALYTVAPAAWNASGNIIYAKLRACPPVRRTGATAQAIIRIVHRVC